MLEVLLAPAHMAGLRVATRVEQLWGTHLLHAAEPEFPFSTTSDATIDDGTSDEEIPV